MQPAEELHGFCQGYRLEAHLVTATIVIGRFLAVGVPVWVVSFDLSTSSAPQPRSSHKSSPLAATQQWQHVGKPARLFGHANNQLNHITPPIVPGQLGFNVRSSPSAASIQSIMCRHVPSPPPSPSPQESCRLSRLPNSPSHCPRTALIQRQSTGR